MLVPMRLRDACRSSPQGAEWLTRLPEVIGQLVRRWSLSLAAPFDEASCSWVAPATRADGMLAVLKVAMPHFEGEQEIEGLRFWDGEPTVRLLDADQELGAMLLERCEPGTPLCERPELEQDVVIAGLLLRLWRSPPPSHRFRPLASMLAYWSEEALALADRWPDPGLVRAGLHLFRELPQSAPAEALLATDLHAGNVLRARREPWLVIDPKPFVGDPAYDATQHLLNCAARLRADPDGTIRRFSDLLEVNHERVRLWMFARLAAGPCDEWRNDAAALTRALAP